MERSKVYNTIAARVSRHWSRSDSFVACRQTISVNCKDLLDSTEDTILAVHLKSVDYASVIHKNLQYWSNHFSTLLTYLPVNDWSFPWTQAGYLLSRWLFLEHLPVEGRLGPAFPKLKLHLHCILNMSLITLPHCICGHCLQTSSRVQVLLHTYSFAYSCQLLTPPAAAQLPATAQLVLNQASFQHSNKKKIVLGSFLRQIWY